MKAKTLGVCLSADLLALAFTYLSYLILGHYERLESQTHGSNIGPGLLFVLCVAITVSAFLTTLIVFLFWSPSEPGSGTGLTPGT